MFKSVGIADGSSLQVVVHEKNKDMRVFFESKGVNIQINSEEEHVRLVERTTEYAKALIGRDQALNQIAEAEID